MAVAITGSIYTETIASGAGSASGYKTITGITVPADADMAVVLSLTCASSNSQFDELNFNGDTDQDFTLIVQRVSGTDAHMRAYRLFNDDAQWPGSGTGRALTFSIGNNMTYGAGYVVLFFLSGVDTSSSWANYLIGTQATGDAQTNWTSPSLGTVGAGDMAIITGGDYTVNVEADTNSQTLIFENMDGSGWDTGMAYKLGEDQPQVTGSFGQYFGAIAFAIKAASAAGTTISATQEAITVTNYNATINAETSFTATLGSVTVTDYNPTLNIATAISSTLGQITLTGYNPSFNVATLIESGIGSITLTGINPDVTATAPGTTIESTLGSIVLTSYNPSLNIATGIVSGIGSVVVTGINPSINIGTIISSGVGSINVSGLNPSIKTDTAFVTSIGSVIVTGYNPTVVPGILIDVTLGTISVTGYDPTIKTDTTITFTAESVVVTPYDATVTNTAAGTTYSAVLSGIDAMTGQFRYIIGKIKLT